MRSLVFSLGLTSGCSHAQTIPPEKILIVYLSRTNNTNAGNGVGTGFQTVRELCTDSKVLSGFEKKGGTERDGQYLVIKDEKQMKLKRK